MSEPTVAEHPARLRFSDEVDVADFTATFERFEAGEITSDDWKKFRRLRGVYEQRQTGRAMIRAKIPGGIAGPEQLRTFATVAEHYGLGRAHMTTRQCVQFHFVPLGEVEAALRLLADGGVTTREACGDSVRNFTCCPLAGVAADEPFDVTPYLEALARHFLRGPFSSKLPRKFKPSIGGCCGTDCSQAFINDLGLLAKVQAGVPGFRVIAGGGLSTLRRSALVVEEFVPATEMLEAAEAVVRCFDRLGNRDNRAKARLKWTIDKLGPEAFIAEYQREREAIRAEGGRPFTPVPIAPPVLRHALAVAIEPRPDFEAWRQHAVTRQRQPGFVVVRIRLRLGDLEAAQLHTLADIVTRFGEGVLRATNDQDLVIRWVDEARVPALHHALADAGLALHGAGTVVDATSCPGAITCQLAVTTSRGMVRTIGEFLEARPALVAKAERLTIKASGCPNSCGQHHVAGIGLQGGVRKVGGKAVPQYLVHVGGGTSLDGARFGRIVGKVPARRVTTAIERLIDLAAREAQADELPDATLARLDEATLSACIHDLTQLDPDSLTDDDTIDFNDGVWDEVRANSELVADL